MEWDPCSCFSPLSTNIVFVPHVETKCWFLRKTHDSEWGTKFCNSLFSDYSLQVGTRARARSLLLLNKESNWEIWKEHAINSDITWHTVSAHVITSSCQRLFMVSRNQQLAKILVSRSRWNTLPLSADTLRLSWCTTGLWVSVTDVQILLFIIAAQEHKDATLSQFAGFILRINCYYSAKEYF